MYSASEPGHADVGFVLQRYAHVLGNDDRDAAVREAEMPNQLWADVPHWRLPITEVEIT